MNIITEIVQLCSPSLPFLFLLLFPSSSLPFLSLPLSPHLTSRTYNHMKRTQFSSFPLTPLPLPVRPNLLFVVVNTRSKGDRPGLPTFFVYYITSPSSYQARGGVGSPVFSEIYTRMKKKRKNGVWGTYVGEGISYLFLFFFSLFSLPLGICE